MVQLLILHWVGQLQLELHLHLVRLIELILFNLFLPIILQHLHCSLHLLHALEHCALTLRYA